MICKKPKHSCQKCIHYRYESDEQRFSCFARSDFTKLFGKDCWMNMLSTIPESDTFKICVNWDTDGEAVETLPIVVEINLEDVHKPGQDFDEDSISNYLSDKYGYCVLDYKVAIFKRDIDAFEEELKLK